ncbi:hypothetical protein [Cyclobacterium jeungdonense]|uniref:Uncharacterized protein n=1 Tax=Cyclobacterium jeungdonense TaxID=708087 RepID=A0ABT8CA15_9BACT|nr:hypothetical protein [Cyclobacterium jeungdonense]MDN3688668.1 hypothetical protein [Cyclobacterium jeungdonense]
MAAAAAGGLDALLPEPGDLHHQAGIDADLFPGKGRCEPYHTLVGLLRSAVYPGGQVQVDGLMV